MVCMCIGSQKFVDDKMQLFTISAVKSACTQMILDDRGGEESRSERSTGVSVEHVDPDTESLSSTAGSHARGCGVHRGRDGSGFWCRHHGSIRPRLILPFLSLQLRRHFYDGFLIFPLGEGLRRRGLFYGGIVVLLQSVVSRRGLLVDCVPVCL